MIRKLFFCSLLISFTALAKDRVTITLKNNSKIKVSNIQLIYYSAPNILCGKFKKGSYVSKKHFKSINIQDVAEVEKNLRLGLCAYKLSYISLLAPNWVNYEVEVVDLPVTNKYSSQVMRSRPIRETFYFLCTTRRDSFGCRGNNTAADIENNNIDIHLNDE